MRSKFIAIVTGAAYLSLFTAVRVNGQIGVLKPEVLDKKVIEKQIEHVHEDGTVCTHDHNHDVEDIVEVTPEQMAATSKQSIDGDSGSGDNISLKRINSPGSTMPIDGAPDANKEFGAGESMKLQPGIHQSQNLTVPWRY